MTSRELSGACDDWPSGLKTFTNPWTIDPAEDEMLKRVPKEYQDGKYPDDVRMKTFTAGHRLTQKAVTSPDFDVVLAKAYARASAYNGFLCDAIGLPY